MLNSEYLNWRRIRQDGEVRSDGKDLECCGRTARGSGCSRGSSTGSSAAPTKGCPGPAGTAGWYCFYENLNYNTSKSGWMQAYTGSSTQATNFAAYVDQLSSVINNSSYRLCIYNNGALLFPVAPYADMPWNSNWNNKADYWRTTTNSSCPPS